MKKIKTTVLLLFASFLVFSCSSDKENAKDNIDKNPIEVKVYKPTSFSKNGFQVSGQVIAKQSAMVSTKVMGVVDRVHVNVGDRVSAGQVLVSVNASDIIAKKAQAQAMIAEAQAASANAQKDYERFKTLRSQNSVSDKELENVALQRSSINAKLEMARQSLNEVNSVLSYASVRAPFFGCGYTEND